jgi:hypothetical protein
MPETANRGTHAAKVEVEPSVARRADSEVVQTLLGKCKTPQEVMTVARKLRYKGGWREEFALYGEAAKKFPEHKDSFTLLQQGMAVNRKIQTFTELERAGVAKIPQKEDLLRIEVEA